MNSDSLKLGGEFPTPDKQDWLKLVDKVLKGADFDKTLVSTTFDDINIAPLYDALETTPPHPGQYPYTRATRALGNAADAWGINQVYSSPDIVESNKAILNDLSRGITEITLDFSDTVKQAHSPQPEVEPIKGLDCYSVNDLDLLLNEVQLNLVPTRLKAGASAIEAATSLMALWQKRGLDKTQVTAFFNADPALTLAQSGHLPASIEQELKRMAALAHYCAAEFPEHRVRAVGVDTAVYHNAGASPAQEIAIALATAIDYLRAMTEDGLSIDDACQQIHFSMSCDTQYFQNIAKLRSLRQLWAQVCKLSGAREDSAKISLSATTSARMLSQRDPWVNMLRTTIASCSAAIGGADAVTTSSFDQALGQSSRLGQRISRNTQLLLQDESSIHKIVDPAGGSFFIEKHCDELSRKAWEYLQTLESRNGLLASLVSGELQHDIAELQLSRETDIAHRRQAITGVSEFANLDEADLASDTIDFAAVRNAAISRLKAVDDALTLAPDDIVGLISACENGVPIPQLNELAKADAVSIEALLQHRDAEQFEALRDAADQFKSLHDAYPSIFAASLGTAAQYNARLGFAKNFFAAAGISLDHDASLQTINETTAAFAQQKATLAVICSNDKNYDENGAELIASLRAAGAKHIYIAGNALQELSDTQITLGCDALSILTSAHQLLEVN